METADLKKLEKKWQKAWEDAKVFEASDKSSKKKYYVAGMFPYPSAEFLHMGHMRNYTFTDVVARHKRMKGYNVLHPIGFDAFGLPAENAAIKDKVHPKKYTEHAIKTITAYMKEMGWSFDWSRSLATCYPEYYKWNQWIFLRMLEKGIAYRKGAPVNWCPSCKTVLANEEVVSGKCWRCDSEVIVRLLEQWFLNTTKYAEELLKGLDKLDWPDRVKELQRNWIGRSEGTKVVFPIKGIDKTLEVFTTRADTIYGVTFLACAVQHPFVEDLVKGTKYATAYKKFMTKVSASEKLDAGKEKEGFFIGRYAIHPLTGKEVPIYAGNFVVADYGTGVVMGVPAHDSRDWDFAKKHKIPIVEVVRSSDSSSGKLKEAYTSSGTLINSDVFSGLDSDNAKMRISEVLAKKDVGGKAVEYQLRDWLLSRQRYWGTPIPIIYCDSCGTVPVPEKDLPVCLPDKVKFTGKGNPLATSSSFVKVKCPACGEPARRETDTMSTFFDSSWYFLRYCSTESHDVFDRKSIGYWMPMDQYVGGIEHATMHLIYARFFTKFLRDIGWLLFDEPFTKLFNQGFVLAKGGDKMSKSKGNVVTTRDATAIYGVDVARFFMLFVAGADKEMEWDNQAMDGAYRSAKKFIGLFERAGGTTDGLTEHKLNKTLKTIDKHYDDFAFNKVAVAFMELVNHLNEKENVPRHVLETMTLMISPIMPHIAEEMWHKIGHSTLVAQESWPKVDESKINDSLEQEEAQVTKTLEDIRQVLSIVKSKGQEASKIYLYVIPNELVKYNSNVLSEKIGLPVKVYAVNDKEKHDPQGKASRSKPGKPALFVE